MICLMHEGSPYGYLKVGQKVILPQTLAQMVGSTLPETKRYLLELKQAGVVSVDKAGCYFSRRMLRDEEVRQRRAAGGFLGGNPALKPASGKLFDDENKVNLQDNLKPTPSSSSSSASASSNLESTALASSGKPLSAAGNGSAVIYIPLNDGTEFPVSQMLVDEWDRLYPNVDIMQTLREIRGWSIANPRKRKTKRGIMAHINTWFNKEQNKPARR